MKEYKTDRCAVCGKLVTAPGSRLCEACKKVGR